MESSHPDMADQSSPDTFSGSSGSLDPSDTDDIIGELLVPPRVGDEYQVEIPPLLNEAELRHLKKNPAYLKGTVYSAHHFATGLSVPVMWVDDNESLTKDANIRPYNNSHAVNMNGIMESRSTTNKGQQPVSKGRSLVPDVSSESWSDFEVDCFVLGLYMFGKNLLQVQKFMDSKEIGQILAFYYGRFYASTGHRRWTDCRKMRNRKCLLGHRFFTGYRQQELFSRLFPCLSEESKNKLLEASKAFVEGSTSLYDYVFSLKALVGIQALVKAAGIGKGKEDITTLFLDRNSSRPEIPSGKACSSLTCPEIVSFLTGDYRLSKARSNDLFWEAVWPRLLARGWHSEQPRGDGYTGSKNSLVFLMPGIKKFSRRKLSKGDHYFDSVTDVLAKVSREPELLELEPDETSRPANTSTGENGWGLEVISHEYRDASDNERHCYLKPRVCSSGLQSGLMVFTVVDTSLANEGNPFKVREVRSLPIEARRSSDETDSESDTDFLPNGAVTSTSSAHAKVSALSENDLNPQQMLVNVHVAAANESRSIEHQFDRRVKANQSACSDPTVKRRRHPVDPNMTCVLSLPARGVNVKIRSRKKAPPPMVSQSLTDVDVVSPDFSVTGISHEVNPKGNSNGNRVLTDALQSNEKMAESKKDIDLNIPQIPTELESNETARVGETEINSMEVETPKLEMDEGKHNTNQCFDDEKPIFSDVSVVSSSIVGPSVEDGGIDVKKPDHSDIMTSLEKASVVGPFIKDGGTNVEIPKNSDVQESVVSSTEVRSSNKDEEMHLDAEKPNVKESAESSTAVRPVNRNEGVDQQPRRQSTRNRPLTTKALEALEFGFMHPVRQYKKRTASAMQEPKPKRPRQTSNKSSMFPDASFEEKEACNGRIDTLANPVPSACIPEVP